MPVSCILKLELISPLIQFFTHGFPLKKRQTQTLFNFNMAFLVVDIDQSGALLSIPNLIINYQLFFFGRTWTLNLDNTINWWDKTKFIIDLHHRYFVSLPAPIWRQHALKYLFPFHNLTIFLTAHKKIAITGFTFIRESKLHTKHKADLQLNTVHAFAFIT